MKTTILLFFLLVTCSHLHCQNVNIPDVAFKNILMNFQPPIDTNGDGEIQYSEAAVIDTLIVGDDWMNYGIQDMTGIEAFVNLVFLDCHNNNITSLNLSQNLLLEELLCYETCLPL